MQSIILHFLLVSSCFLYCKHTINIWPICYIALLPISIAPVEVFTLVLQETQWLTTVSLLYSIFLYMPAFSLVIAMVAEFEEEEEQCHPYIESLPTF